jgi:molecular chaperone HscA
MAGDARQEGYAVGVDLGTSNTVAVLRWPDGHTRPLLFDGAPIMPSGVFLDDAGQLHVGRDAQRMAQLDPARFEPNPKRRIDEAAVLLGDREVDVVDLLAAVLSAVSRAAVEAVGFLPAAVLTYPASWGPVRRERLATAAARAGWPPVVLVPEPVAAARYFADVLRRPVPFGASLAVFDFGGGTLDIAVVRNGGGRFAVLGSGGIQDLGGLDVDAALVSHLADVISDSQPEAWRSIKDPRTTAERRSRRLFWDDVRDAKEMLSRVSVAPVAVPIVDRAVHLTREELERVASPLLRRAVHETAAVIRRCGLRPDQLAGLFLVGGSSRLPLVARLLHAELGIAPTVLEQPELPVAEGALAEIVRSAAAGGVNGYATTGVPVSAVPVSGGPGLASGGPGLAGPGAPAGFGPVTAKPTSAAAYPGAAVSPAPVGTAPVSPAYPSGTGPVSPPAGGGPPSGGRPAAAGGVSMPGRANAWYAKPITWIAAVAAVLVLVIVATTGYVLLRRGEGPVDFQTLQSMGRIGTDLSGSSTADMSVALAGDTGFAAWQSGENLEVAAVDLTNGKKLWSRTVGGTAKQWLDIIAYPGIVIATAQDFNDNNPRGMYVLDAATGNPRWNRNVFGDDYLIPFNDVVVLVSPHDHTTIGLSPHDGTKRWELPDPADSDGDPVDTMVFGVSTGKDLAGPADLDGYPQAPDYGDDRRLLQITYDRKLNVINADTGKVEKRRAAVGTTFDRYLAHDGRLFVFTRDNGYRVQAYDLAKLGEPQVIYTAQDPRRGVDAMAPCGPARLCLLDTSSSDPRTTELVAIDVAGRRQLWRRPATGTDRLVPVGDRILATSVDGRPASFLFDPDGRQLLHSEDLAGVGVRVNAGSLIFFSGTPNSYPSDTSLAGVGAKEGGRVALGPIPQTRSKECGWNERVILCAAANDFALWRFARD